MRAVVQRVREAEVTVDGRAIGTIARGLVVLAGLASDDGEADVAWMAQKIAGLRVFDDGTAERSVVEVGGGVLVISQFTLLGDCRKGRRPSFDRAMPAAAATALFDRFVTEMHTAVPLVATGAFGADMRVRLVNDGPFTLVVDSPRSESSTTARYASSTAKL